MILYHGTSMEALTGITGDGCMTPNKLNSSQAVEEGWAEAVDHDGYLFFTDFLGEAIHFASYAMANGHNPDTCNLVLVLVVSLPHQQLELVSNTNYSREFRHAGSISAESITEVLLCDYETENIVARTTLDKWEEAIEEKMQHIK